MLARTHSVALLAEGVDRNLRHLGNYHVLRVALLAEGVDRNNNTLGNIGPIYVALLAEGVDRNHLSTLAVVELMRRPPRRGRG